MDNGWSKAIKVGQLPAGDQRPIVVDMDPAADPTLFWAGKRNRREVPILPLQRNEIISESRIAQIIDRARKAAIEKAPQMTLASIFADLEKSFRESDKSKRVEFYTHDEGWKNKLICGDSLHVMESFIHYENLRGQSPDDITWTRPTASSTTLIFSSALTPLRTTDSSTGRRRTDHQGISGYMDTRHTFLSFLPAGAPLSVSRDAVRHWQRLCAN